MRKEYILRNDILTFLSFQFRHSKCYTKVRMGAKWKVGNDNKMRA